MRRSLEYSASRIATTLVVVLIIVFIWASSSASAATRPQPRLEAERLQFTEPRAVPVDYVSGGVGAAVGTAIVSGDFDEDGVPDLVCGYARESGGVLALHRGNVDALYPNAPGARLRGNSGEPFLRPVTTVEVPVRPDFIVEGDFDNDGHRDVVVAGAGEARLHLLAGDGRGGLRLREPIELSGFVTALAAGEIDRADGRVDLVVGVREAAGPAVLVFAGLEGLLETPRVIHVSAAPTALLLGTLAGGPWHDLAIAAGNELWVVRGRDRRERDATPQIDRVRMPASIADVAWGDFAWESGAGQELALALHDGTIRILELAATEDDAYAWVTVSEIAAGVPGRLLALRVSGSTTQDLALLDPASPRLRLFTGMTPESDGVSTSIELSEPLAAALPMRLGPGASTELVALVPGHAGPSVMGPATESLIRVNVDFDVTIPGDGACTLREAIVNANTDSDTTLGDCFAGSGTDTITFGILGGGAPATIAVSAALPALSDAVVIDGTSQGCATPPCIVLNGASLGVGSGLVLTAGSSGVHGLVIQQFPDRGILISSSGNVIEGNFIGTDLSGTVALGNGNAGIRVDTGATGNIIGGPVDPARNVVSGNAGQGIVIRDDSNGNHVLGNYVGTDITGTIALGNAYHGVYLRDSSNNTVGGAAPGEGNVISSNSYRGVFLYLAGASANLIQGNLIGTDVSGALALPNAFDGILLQGAPANTIGGTAVGARNLVSGNGQHGIFIWELGATGNEILGNYIGTEVSGTAALPNSSHGVMLRAPGNTVGGLTAEARNVISGNDRRGVTIWETHASGNTVLGNYIGTDVTGTVALRNIEAGVGLIDAPNNTVGGPVPAARNIISGNNRGVGIWHAPSSGNQILGNFIGTDVTGTVKIPNTKTGILISDAPNNTIGGTAVGAGNVISGNGEGGIQIGGTPSSGNEILGNLIGTDVAGLGPLGNNWSGVFMGDTAGNTVGGTTPGARNIISGNGADGVRMYDTAATGNDVLGNYIGTDINGIAALPNSGNGVVVWIAPDNRVGGAAVGAGNLISGNGLSGVLILEPGATNNQVQGNFIGTDATGTVALPNGQEGVFILEASLNTIGGTSAGAGNVISGNDFNGVGIYSDLSTGNEILGNLIGTDVTGTARLGNTYNGVFLRNTAGNTVGASAPGGRNIISANGVDGVRTFSTPAAGNDITGNYIGTDVTGNVALGNSVRGVSIENSLNNTVVENVISGNWTHGVAIIDASSVGNVVVNNLIGTDVSGAPVLGNLEYGVRVNRAIDNLIGGTGPADGNLIAGNGMAGVLVVEPGAKSNAILGNSIHSNTLLGIALETDTVWVNDPGDPDLGCNDFQNFPVLSAVNVTATTTTVDGWLDTLPGQTYHLEFFVNSVCDPSMHGPGEMLLGTLAVTTNAAGFASFSQTFPNVALISNLVTATATDPFNSTSEFSICGTDIDVDGDTVSDLDDCAPGDPQAWTLPGEALDLTLQHNHGTGVTTLSWDPPTPYGSMPALMLFDTIVSDTPSDFVTTAWCAETDDGPNTDSQHGTDPSAGQVYYFLARPENPCGHGITGQRSDGTPRVARTCP